MEFPIWHITFPLEDIEMEKLVYQITEDVGNMGIWTRDICNEVNLTKAKININKILKTVLEGNVHGI